MGKKFNFVIAILVWCCVACAPPSDTITECQGAISSATPLATAAGWQILNAGGNAADAAVAISFVLGVTEPAMSGIGGGCQILLSEAGNVPISIDGSTLAPLAADTTVLRSELTAYTKSTVPSMVKTMFYLYEHYGSGQVTWAQLLAPAIEIAEQGFQVGSFRAKVFQQYGQGLLDNYPLSAPWVISEHALPQPGDTLRNLRLAQTLRTIATKPNDFYSGEIAQAIVDDMKINGGWISAEDLSSFPPPEVRPAIMYSYQGHEVYSAPAPAAGPTLFKILELLEKDTTSNPLRMVNALNQGHKWRSLGLTTESGETTHFSVTDGSMSLAVTASINAYFGSKTAHPRLGFLYNSYLTDFEFGDSKHWNALQPGKPAYSSMTPVIVRKNSQDLLVMGSPGSKRIISTMAQLIDHWVHNPGDSKMLELPRTHAIDSTVWLETTNPALVASLTNYGFDVKYPTNDLQQNGLNAYFGGVHALLWTSSKWSALADPRRDGLARHCSQ